MAEVQNFLPEFLTRSGELSSQSRFNMDARAPTRRLRQAKIVATLGPSSSTPAMIRALFEAGADVFRFNFSHGTHAEHQARYDIVRAIEQETGRPIAVLADLQGPKLRIGQLESGPIELRERRDAAARPGANPGTRRKCRCRIRKSSPP